MVSENLRDHQRNSPGRRDMQEFVRAMRIGMRSEHPGDDKLRLRELLAEHCHERDAAALSHIGGRRPEGELGAARERMLKPGRQGRGVPAGGARLDLKLHPRSVRRAFLEKGAQRCAGLCRVERRRQT